MSSLPSVRAAQPDAGPVLELARALASIPFMNGQLLEFTATSVASTDVQHGLRRRYKGGFVLSQDQAQAGLVVLSASVVAAAGEDPERKIRVYNPGGSNTTALMWVF